MLQHFYLLKSSCDLLVLNTVSLWVALIVLEIFIIQKTLYIFIF